MFPKKVGILGGGQLSRMLALECYHLGLIPLVYSKSKNDPAAQVVKDWFEEGDKPSFESFVFQSDVVTIENEFIDRSILNYINFKKKLLPGLAALSLCQNKLEQKKFLVKNKIPTAPFIDVNNLKEFENAEFKLGSRIVLKQSMFGYDGKGTFFFDLSRSKANRASQMPPGFEMDKFSGYAEETVKFDKELAVVVARSKTGKIVTFPVVETVQSNGICEKVYKANVSSKVALNAQKIAQSVIKKAEGVGVFAVEMFLLSDSKILVNEIAPRVHNSGHITLDACNVNQFEQHLRAVTGMDLIEPFWTAKDAVMLNILGKVDGGKPALENKINTLNVPENVYLYWYGKSELRVGRKLGHINATGETLKTILAKAEAMRKKLTV